MILDDNPVSVHLINLIFSNKYINSTSRVIDDDDDE